jgi:hypothetical protein
MIMEENYGNCIKEDREQFEMLILQRVTDYNILFLPHLSSTS